MAKKKEELTIAQKHELAQVDTFIEKAIASGATVEVLNGLFELQQKAKAAAAAEAFVRSLGAFQSQCPVIEKTKKVLNKDGRTVRYQFAPLESIVEQIKAFLVENGLSYSWDVKHIEHHMEVTCKVTHVLGHSETSTFAIPIDADGYMTAPQKYASAQTFAKRYTLCNALGITTGDEDDDATTVKKEADAKDPKAKIVLRLRTLGEKTGTKEEIEAAVTRLAKLDLIPGNFDEIITRLEVAIADRQEAND